VKFTIKRVYFIIIQTYVYESIENDGITYLHYKKLIYNGALFVHYSIVHNAHTNCCAVFDTRGLALTNYITTYYCTGENREKILGTFCMFPKIRK